jgi:glycosyltransferase involved in cell wall biosynthesis
MRLAVYTDYVYRRVDGVVYAERAFALFLAALTPHVEHLRLIGRLASRGGATRYALPAEVDLAGLPHYESLADPIPAVRSLLGSTRRMWHALDEIDVVWILGPYPHAVLLAILALVRRTPVVIGVRQDWPSYVRTRRPGRRWMHLSADVLEWIWRTLARRLPVVAVGSELSAKYGHAPAVLDVVVSMVPTAELEHSVRTRGWAADRQILSVGRLDEEKNPLLLADVLALLLREDERWRLRVCGEGDLANQLSDRLNALGVRDRADLLGYVPMGDALFELYRSSHVLLHVSWTEGFPQVLVEAFACGLPVVATDVGGVRAGVDGAALVIAPGDARAAADALSLIARDAELRARLTEAGLARARELTLEAQTARLAEFLSAALRR